MFLLRVLRGSQTPPLVSPLTTRAGRKRKQLQEQEDVPRVNSNHGELDVSMVTGWFSDALHHFITVKYVSSSTVTSLDIDSETRTPRLSG